MRQGLASALHQRIWSIVHATLASPATASTVASARPGLTSRRQSALPVQATAAPSKGLLLGDHAHATAAFMAILILDSPVLSANRVIGTQQNLASVRQLGMR
jgi:hypothetical protein